MVRKENRAWLVMVIAVAMIVACSGKTTTGQRSDASGVGGVAGGGSGGIGESGGAISAGGTGGMPPGTGGGCTDGSQCPVGPVQCLRCPDGGAACPWSTCVNGTCVSGGDSCSPTWHPSCACAGSYVCPANIRAGDPCTPSGSYCTLQGTCGDGFICTIQAPAADPNIGHCPVSRAKYKTDIQYLSIDDRAKLADAVQSIPLVRYRYKDGPEREHLGFIIEDVEPSPGVDSQRDQVDLYGYTSMTVAALQQQHREIEALKGEVKELRSRLSRRPPRANKAAGVK
jgi:hypothetical protein